MTKLMTCERKIQTSKPNDSAVSETRSPNPPAAARNVMFIEMNAGGERKPARAAI